MKTNLKILLLLAIIIAIAIQETSANHRLKRKTMQSKYSIHIRTVIKLLALVFRFAELKVGKFHKIISFSHFLNKTMKVFTKAELPQEGIFFRTQFPSLGIFFNEKVGN